MASMTADHRPQARKKVRTGFSKQNASRKRAMFAWTGGGSGASTVLNQSGESEGEPGRFAYGPGTRREHREGDQEVEPRPSRAPRLLREADLVQFAGEGVAGVGAHAGAVRRVLGQ